MKQVISVRDLEEMLRTGKDVRSLPEDALLTPSARDYLRDLDGAGGYRVARKGATHHFAQFESGNRCVFQLAEN